MLVHHEWYESMIKIIVLYFIITRCGLSHFSHKLHQRIVISSSRASYCRTLTIGRRDYAFLIQSVNHWEVCFFQQSQYFPPVSQFISSTEIVQWVLLNSSAEYGMQYEFFVLQLWFGAHATADQMSNGLIQHRLIGIFCFRRSYFAPQFQWNVVILHF